MEVVCWMVVFRKVSAGRLSDGLVVFIKVSARRFSVGEVVFLKVSAERKPGGVVVFMKVSPGRLCAGGRKAQAPQGTCLDQDRIFLGCPPGRRRHMDRSKIDFVRSRNRPSSEPRKNENDGAAEKHQG